MKRDGSSLCRIGRSSDVVHRRRQDQGQDRSLRRFGAFSDPDAAPAYMPANCGWLSPMTHLSMSVVANGQPSASIAFCACFCKPSREIVKAGNATTDFASLIRSAMTAIAFCNAVPFDRSSIGLTSSRHDRRLSVVRRHGDIGRPMVAARLGDDALHFDDTQFSGLMTESQDSTRR